MFKVKAALFSFIGLNSLLEAKQTINQHCSSKKNAFLFFKFPVLEHNHTKWTPAKIIYEYRKINRLCAIFQQHGTIFDSHLYLQILFYYEFRDSILEDF